MTERWLPIPEDNRYEVSDQGRVRNQSTEHVLKPWTASRGYLYVALGRACKRLVARLVLMTFVGQPAARMDACHNDGSLTNNRLENLRWDTRAGNLADQLKHGTRIRGEKHALAKLTAEGVREIRRLATRKVSQRKIAEKFGVSKGLISRISRGLAWAHV